MSDIMIYYLAHPWAFNPNKSFENAVNWTSQLRQKGIIVFSPILHTHPYWQQLMMSESLEYVENEDWLDWDLKLIEGFSNGDGHAQYGVCSGCGRKQGYKKNFWCLWCDSDVIEQPAQFDTGITVLMDASAIGKDFSMKKGWEFMQTGNGDLGTWKAMWQSQGCRQEYERAKSKYIRVLDLKSFLEGVEKEI